MTHTTFVKLTITIRYPHPNTTQAEQDYPEAGISSLPSFTKYEELGEENLDEWVENGFGEFDDVEER